MKRQRATRLESFGWGAGDRSAKQSLQVAHHLAKMPLKRSCNVSNIEILFSPRKTPNAPGGETRCRMLDHSPPGAKTPCVSSPEDVQASCGNADLLGERPDRVKLTGGGYFR